MAAGGAKWGGALFLALVLCLGAATAAQGMRERRRHGGRRSYRSEGQGERKFRLEEPRKGFESEGGHVRVWDTLPALEENDVYVRSARITLRERGLALPVYDDAACIGYVEEGEGLVGFLSGYSLGETVRRVRRGDVVTFPKGVAHWWYNTGSQELRILGFADTSSGLIPGQFTVFSLVGGSRGGLEEGNKRYGHGEGQRELRSILHGFKPDFLADAWNVDEKEVMELLDSQPGVGIIKAERDIDLSELPGSGTYHTRRHRRDDEPTSVAAADSGIGGGGYEHDFSRGLLGDFPSDFVFNVLEATPDQFVEGAGRGVVVDKIKLPLLSYCKLGMSYTRLEKAAIFAPHWSPTGHRVLHFLRGRGHIEIAGHSGRREVSTQVQEGDAYIIPRFYPAGVRAGDEGLEFISFYTTDVPFIEALAGKTSVFKSLPTHLTAAAFNVDEERVREFRKRRTRAAILLPPAKYQGGRREPETVNKVASV